MYIASYVSFFACISSSLIWKHLGVSSKKYCPTTWIPVWWIFSWRLSLWFFYFYFNDIPISHFIFISSQAVLRSLLLTGVSRKRLSSMNKILNVGFNYVIWRFLILLKGIRPIEINWLYVRCWFCKSWWHQCKFFSVSISCMVVVSQSCLCIITFWLYWNQPRSVMALLLGSNSTNDFTQALLIMVMISVRSNYIPLIIC